MTIDVGISAEICIRYVYMGAETAVLCVRCCVCGAVCVSCACRPCDPGGAVV